MKLSFIKPYKSISDFPEIELPDFVVITGVNGAGKSHLLEAIENGSMEIYNIGANKPLGAIRRFDSTNMIPNDTGASDPYQIIQKHQELWDEISQYIKKFRAEVVQTLHDFNQGDLCEVKMREIINIPPEYLIERGCSAEVAHEIVKSLKNIVKTCSKNVRSHFSYRQESLDLIEKKSGIPLIAIEGDDFYAYWPKSRNYLDMFQQSFAELFATYQGHWIHNEFRCFQNSKGYDSISFLTEDKFKEKHGQPPWEFVNSIFETANLDFSINKPEECDFRPYQPILTDRVRKSEVQFSDLSSGERILMSFALCLYYARDDRQIVDYPKILLFDEIDAPLHPSMTQSLLNTIQEILVKKHGIKVILTTHSPSTVALAPEDSLYTMYKTSPRRMQKSTKDKALAILTAGVPTLSIDYENRRQVFVESHYDAKFYEGLYKKLKNHLIPDVSLTFIASGSNGKGDCQTVKKVVKQLEEGGNKTVYGIIDWDLKNSGNDRIKVLGEENRYSIENYILDPLLLAAFLFRERWIERNMIGLNDNETYIDFAKFDTSRLQQIADFLVKKVKPHLPQKSTDDKTDQIECKYVNGKTIKLPKFYLQTQGHQLEDSLKKTFPQLKRFKEEDKLKMEIIRKVIDDIPGLIPDDLLCVFKQIQDM